MDDGCGQEEYIRRVLEAYRQTPGTAGTVRRPDRVLAGQLYQRGVSVTVIENAFVLAATRRLMRPADARPLGTIRSLAAKAQFLLAIAANDAWSRLLALYRKAVSLNAESAELARLRSQKISLMAS